MTGPSGRYGVCVFLESFPTHPITDAFCYLPVQNKQNTVAFISCCVIIRTVCLKVHLSAGVEGSVSMHVSSNLDIVVYLLPTIYYPLAMTYDLLCINYYLLPIT